MASQAITEGIATMSITLERPRREIAENLKKDDSCMDKIKILCQVAGEYSITADGDEFSTLCITQIIFHNI